MTKQKAINELLTRLNDNEYGSLERRIEMSLETWLYSIPEWLRDGFAEYVYKIVDDISPKKIRFTDKMHTDIDIRLDDAIDLREVSDLVESAISKYNGNLGDYIQPFD